MKDRRKRNIMIGSLCALLVFMGIGYAIISQMLTIRGVSTVAGDWNIYIDSITPNAVGTGVSVSESVGLDKISASFEANLYAPGDKVEYKIVVKNDGNIDAKLGAVNQHVTNDTEGIVKYSNTLENGYILRHGESYVFYVTTELPEELEEIPENTVRAVLDLKLNFTQYTGSGSGEEDNPVHDETTLLASGDISKTENDNVTWKYYSDGALVISGYGDMLNMDSEIYTPVTDANSARGLEIRQQIVGQILNKMDPTNYSYTSLFQSDGHNRLRSTYQMAIICLSSDTYFQNVLSLEYGTEISSLDDFINLMVSRGEVPIEYESMVRDVCSHMPQITSIEFEDDSLIKSIGNYAFSRIGYGGEVSIPNSVISIGYDAFENNAISSVNFNNTTALKSIGYEAFESNEISSLVLPESLTSLGWQAFSRNNLTNLTINGTYTSSSIDLDAFDCNPDLNINSIVINATIDGEPLLSSQLIDINNC